MTKHTVLWAQALDNASADHIEDSGEALSPDQTVLREKAVSRVSRVIKDGSLVFEQEGIKLTVAGRCFVAEVTGVERDCAGRMAPIVCCAEYDTPDADVLADYVIKHISDFAERIGRRIPPDHQNLLIKAFTKATQKKKRTRRAQVIAVLAVGSVGAVATVWLIYRLFLKNV